MVRYGDILVAIEVLLAGGNHNIGFRVDQVVHDRQS